MTKIHTIEVVGKPVGGSDTVSALEESLRDIGVNGAKTFSTSFFSLVGDFDDKTLSNVSDLVHHHVTQDVFIDRPLETEQEWDFAIKVDYKPVLLIMLQKA